MKENVQPSKLINKISQCDSNSNTKQHGFPQFLGRSTFYKMTWYENNIVNGPLKCMGRKVCFLCSSFAPVMLEILTEINKSALSRVIGALKIRKLVFKSASLPPRERIRKKTIFVFYYCFSDFILSQNSGEFYTCDHSFHLLYNNMEIKEATVYSHSLRTVYINESSYFSPFPCVSCLYAWLDMPEVINLRV